MARGYPDYFGYSMFPSYGNLLELEDGFGIAAGETITIMELNHKGMICGGYIRLEGDIPLNNYLIIPHIDGVAHVDFLAITHYNYGLHLPDGHMFYVSYLNNVDNEVVFSMSPGFPFGVSLAITIQNTSLEVGLCTSRLLYNVYV